MHAFTPATRPPFKNPRGWKSCALGAAVVAALLSTTACDPSGTDGPDGTTPADPSSATGPAKPGESTTPPPTTSTPTSAPTSASAPAPAPKPSGSADDGEGSGGGGGGGSTNAACATGDLSFSVTNEDEAGKEVRHLLLAAENVGHKKCDLYRYPDVRFDADARNPVLAIKDSDLKEPATLAPGEVAYAALLATGGHMDTYDAKSLTLRLQGAESGSALGRPVDVTLPRGMKTLTTDSGSLVTHWIPTASGLALRFIMSR
ncbi:DUF4232 domain-containing protein [Streptomyces sp. NPDC048717]|uniref:DUF4232 domain-containing protein n=1 Tax=Streptomyces sp. NPDC048717 TaxID=3154928 RepID=UPI00343E9DF2